MGNYGWDVFHMDMYLTIRTVFVKLGCYRRRKTREEEEVEDYPPLGPKLTLDNDEDQKMQGNLM